MHKGIVAFVLGFCVLGAALAADLPEGELVVTLADGTIVGVGELEDGGLELELLAGTSGFVTFTVTGDDGVVVSFEVAVGEDGSLTMVDSFEDLAGTIAEAGGEVDVSFEETVDYEGAADGAAHATGLDRADEKASDHAAAGLARARAARDGDAAAEDEVEDAEVADEAEEEAERAAEEAERAAEEAEEAAERAAEEAEEEADAAEEEEEDDDDSDDESADSRAADRGGKPQHE